MSLNSTTSRLIEQVNSQLLSESNWGTTVLLDNTGSDADSYENATPIKSPFTVDSSHFLPNNKLMDLERFIEIADELIQDGQYREGTIESERVSLVEEYPAEKFDRFGDEVIAWKLINRKPAAMSTDGRSRLQKGYTFYRSVRLPNHPNKILDIETRPLDHIVEFQCWSKSARLANRRALWLERLFVNHSWAFIAQGTDRFRFQERLSDWYTTPGGQHLYVRPLRFLVRAYEFRVKADSVIKHFSFEVGASTSDVNNT